MREYTLENRWVFILYLNSFRLRLTDFFCISTDNIFGLVSHIKESQLISAMLHNSSHGKYIKEYVRL